MAYLSPDYRHDMFVSYSHGDPEGTGTSSLRTWSQNFASRLQSAVRETPKFKDFAMFIDANKRVEHGLDRTLPLSENIRESLERSALLTIVMGPHYLDSGWCRDERERWLDHHKEHAGRVFVVRIWPTGDKKWPAELCDLNKNPPLGFWFYSQPGEGEGEGYDVRPFHWDERASDKTDYTNAVLQLAAALGRRLDELRKALDDRRRREEEAKRLKAETGQSLYLCARETHQELWREAHDALGRAGYVVTPAQPEPTGNTPKRIREINEERVNQLIECDALLLLGTKDGFALDGDMLRVGRQRRNLARDRSERLLPCAVLDKSGGSVATEPRLSNARKMDIDWIDGRDSGWPQQLRSWLQESGRRLAT